MDGSSGTIANYNKDSDPVGLKNFYVSLSPTYPSGLGEKKKKECAADRLISRRSYHFDLRFSALSFSTTCTNKPR